MLVFDEILIVSFNVLDHRPVQTHRSNVILKFYGYIYDAVRKQGLASAKCNALSIYLIIFG